jgi:hypothetical protein
MRYSNIKKSVVEQFKAPQGHKIVPFILGAPGGGKSACAREIMDELGLDTVVEFTASLRDPVDVLGTPNNTGEFTRWVPPEEFYKLRKGRVGLILEELSDAPIPMQNALCGVVYDRRAGNLMLANEQTPEDVLFIIATGNRTEDKSGANRITSKLANRTRRFDFQENLDDLTAYALDSGWKTDLIQFLRFRPGLISDFDANRFANPTPRSWERVSLVPDSLDASLFLENVIGEVGEGAAAEYVGFRRIYSQLPNIDALLLDPKGAQVPTDPAVRYAITGALARKATVDNIDRVMAYTSRLPAEFAVMTIKDSIKLAPKITQTRAFIEWSTANAEVLM